MLIHASTFRRLVSLLMGLALMLGLPMCLCRTGLCDAPVAEARVVQRSCCQQKEHGAHNHGKPVNCECSKQLTAIVKAEQTVKGFEAAPSVMAVPMRTWNTEALLPEVARIERAWMEPGKRPTTDLLRMHCALIV